MPNEEKKIEYYIRNFIKFADLDVSEKIIDTFMSKTTLARTLILPFDNMLMIEEYLTWKEYLYFSTCCKNHMSLLPYFWRSFKEVYFPKSIIPMNEYKTFALNASLDWYYSYPAKYYLENIRKHELRMAELTKIIDKLSPNNVNYKTRLITNTKERENEYRDRNDILLNPDEISDDVGDFLALYRHNSVVNYSGEKYFTLKPDIDMRLYGFNPDIPEEKARGEIKIKWVSYEYNTLRDYNYILNGESDDEYEYRYEYNLEEDSDRYPIYNGYRTRIKPDWV